MIGRQNHGSRVSSGSYSQILEVTFQSGMRYATGSVFRRNSETSRVVARGVITSAGSDNLATEFMDAS